jgi:hypothetical protein
MTWPLQFPDPQEEARERAEKFQRLPPAEQFRQLVDTIETGMALIRESPNRSAIDKLFVEREQQWQEIQKELFRRHVK